MRAALQRGLVLFEQHQVEAGIEHGDGDVRSHGPGAREQAARGDRNRSLERGIDNLRAFKPGADVLGSGELAVRTGLSRATVSRLTQTLVHSGMLEHDRRRRAYRLAAPVLRRAHAMRSGSPILQIAGPLMRREAEPRRINVVLAVADRDEMVDLESVRYSRRVAWRNVVEGERVPMELTSLGRAWLSAATDEQRRGLMEQFRQRRTSGWRDLARGISAAIDSVHRHGDCWASRQPQVVALATPVVVADHPVYVLNMSITGDAEPAEVVERLRGPLLSLRQRRWSPSATFDTPGSPSSRERCGSTADSGSRSAKPGPEGSVWSQVGWRAPRVEGTAVSKHLRWGILGTGWIADLFVQDLQLTGHQVSSVGSRTPETAQRFAARFGIPNAHGSYEGLVADPQVDIVYVATPHPMHASNATAALNAGKHVLIEKPFTLNAAEARAIVDLATARNLVVLEAMWTRFLPHMRRIREIIASGALGTVYSVVADHTRDLPDDPKHRLNALELGGGALLDLGIYPISFAWDILGQPQEILSMARFKATGADAEVATLFRHAGGAMSTTISSSDNGGRNVASILGTEARIDIDATWYAPTSFRLVDSQDQVIESYVSEVPGRGMQFQADEIERLVAAGSLAGDILPPEESVAIMQTLDTIRAQIGLRYPGE